MIRAKWNSDNVANTQSVFFSDVDEPVYPMVGDEYELYDEDNSRTVIATVSRVHFPSKMIYLEPDWSTLIDTCE